MPLNDSPPVSSPYTNGLPPTPYNLTPLKRKLSVSTYHYVPPPSLNHPHLTRQYHTPHSQHVRNLCFHIDTTLSIDYHIIHMHTSIYYHLHCLRLIRHSIHLPIAITIAYSSSCSHRIEYDTETAVKRY